MRPGPRRGGVDLGLGHLAKLLGVGGKLPVRAVALLLDFRVGFVAAVKRADGVVQRRLRVGVERAEFGGLADLRERFAPDDPLPDAALDGVLPLLDRLVERAL